MRTVSSSRYFLTALCVLWSVYFGIPLAAGAAEPFPILTYEFGQTRKPLLAIERQIGDATPPEREEIEARLLATLASPSASVDCKGFVCRMLKRVGTDRSVPALAKLLAEEKLSHLARFALQPIESPAVDEVSRESLDKLHGEPRIGVIHTIADRGDRRAVGQLAALAGNEDAALAEAASAALGRIGGIEAAQALAGVQVVEPLKAVHTEARLTCADGLLAEGKTSDAARIYHNMFAQDHPARFRVVLLRGIVRAEEEQAAATVLEVLRGKDVRLQRAAAELAAHVPGVEATKAFAAELSSLSPAVQVVLIAALAAKGDKSAATEIVPAAASDNVEVRTAALRALGKLGGTSEIELLTAAASEVGDLGETAFSSLVALDGPGVAEAILSRMKTADPAGRVTLIRAAATRGLAEAAPLLWDLSADQNDSIRVASIEALGSLAVEKELPTLIGKLADARDEQDRNAWEGALLAMCRRTKAPDELARRLADSLEGADVPTRCSLLHGLGELQSQRAIGVLKSALENEHREIRDEAIRGLARSKHVDVLPTLLRIAAETKEPAHNIAAVRGYARLVRDSSMSDAKKLSAYRKIVGLTSRPEDLGIVLNCLGDVRTIESLRMIASYLDDQEMRNIAVTAAINVAVPRVRGDAGLEGDEVVAVLEKLLLLCSDYRARSVENHLKRIKQ